MSTASAVRRYHARWVLPISHPALADATVVVERGRVAWVGPRADAPASGRAEDVDLGDVALLPGLVNAHTHLELTAMRGFLEELPFASWIRRLTAARREVLDDAALLDSSRLGVMEGIRAGITTYADTSESGTPLEAMRELGVRGIVYHEVFGPDPAQCNASMDALRARVALARTRESALVRVGISPHAPYSVSDALFSAAAAYARAEGLPIAVHLAESEDEARLVAEGDGPFAAFLRGRGIDVAPRAASPVELLDRTGVLAARTLLIHCVRVDARDIARLAGHDCAVAHCPASNAKLGHGIAPLAELLAAGVRVALGSDSVASNNRMDVLEEARLALLMQRARAQRHDVLSAAAVLELATLGGARALGLDAEIGSLEPGKSADLAAFPLDGPRLAPAFAIEDVLVHAAAGRPATFVCVAGEELLRDDSARHDERTVRQRVAAHAARLESWRRPQPVPATA
jgi:cytosine/adenosine deaminase-related metal-dependent hydrolase